MVFKHFRNRGNEAADIKWLDDNNAEMWFRQFAIIADLHCTCIYLHGDSIKKFVKLFMSYIYIFLTVYLSIRLSMGLFVYEHIRVCIYPSISSAVNF